MTQNHFHFGDSEPLCEALLALVRAGKKAATCDSLAFYEQGGDQLPEPGRRDIVTHWDGTPALEIETTQVTLCRFDEVTEAFALAEGENDDLAGWRRDHEAYFRRTGAFSPRMTLVCERFRVIRDLTKETE